MRIAVSATRLFLFIVCVTLLTFRVTANDREAMEKQITDAPHGHILTNIGVWSPNSRWIVYDTRSDPAGSQFDASQIQRVNVETGQVEVLYQSDNDAHIGVATYSTTEDRIAFIHGPERRSPDPSSDDWAYAAYHRCGVFVDTDRPGVASNIDARNLTPPFTPGALRGGTHVHTFSGDGRWIAFTYEDHLLATLGNGTEGDLNQRNVGVSVPIRAVQVPHSHERNHDGAYFTVLVTQTENVPKFGSNEISKAFSDSWIGTNGYLKADGTRQQKAIAFQGHVHDTNGDVISEVFIVDLPMDITSAAEGQPLAGTETRRPYPPAGVSQRRLTFTTNRKYPGLQGVRHWLRSSPDGAQIAFLMKDGEGVSQLWTIPTIGGAPRQRTHNQHDIDSAFSWSPDGQFIAHIMDRSVCITKVDSGETVRLTKPNPNAPLRPEACVVSPDGKQIAYVRQVNVDATSQQRWNQIFTVPTGQ